MNLPGGYVLDANVFIEAHRRYYAFDICPGYWDALLAQYEAGRICSVDHVRNELVGLGDALSNWVKQMPSSVFAETSNQAVMNTFSNMMTWVKGQTQYSSVGIADFARVADGWLIAYAQVQGLTVVTHEVPNPAIRKKVPIPNVCNAFGVKWINTFEMLRALGVAFK